MKINVFSSAPIHIDNLKFRAGTKSVQQREKSGSKIGRYNKTKPNKRTKAANQWFKHQLRRQRTV